MHIQSTVKKGKKHTLHAHVHKLTQNLYSSTHMCYLLHLPTEPSI